MRLVAARRAHRIHVRSRSGGDELRITVRHEEKSEHNDKRGYRSEIRYGTFARTVRLPAAVDEKDGRASYTDAIFEVRVPAPKQMENNARKIPVTRSGQSAGATTQDTGPAT